MMWCVPMRPRPDWSALEKAMVKVNQDARTRPMDA